MNFFDQFVTELERFDPELAKEVGLELQREFERERVMAAVRQKEIAVGQQARRMIDGIGQVTMSVDPMAYHYWGQRLGYGCWKDKQFLHEIRRDNPEVRVPTVKNSVIVRP